MTVKQNHIVGLVCIIVGAVIAIFALGDLLLRVVIALTALSLVNYGLKLRGIPPLQLLLPMMASRKRWF